MRSSTSRFLWIPLLALLLVPVVLRMHSSGPVPATGGAGVLLRGPESLDSLLEAWSGRPVVVNFWATWCTPCVRELPLLDSLSRQRSGSVMVVAIDAGDPDPSTAEEFLERMPLSIPVVWLGEADADSVMSRMQVPPTFPFTIFLDASGNEAGRAAGARDYSFFESMASSLATGAGAGAVDGGSGAGMVHVNVVGPPGDSLTEELMEAAILAAGEGNVSFFDPGSQADMARLDSLFLPAEGWPYAQPCAGSSCGRPLRTPEELIEAIGQLASP